MKSDTTVREEIREFEAGWVPWVLAAAYFPVYVVLDFLAGDVLASRLGLPQSISVGLVSLTVAGLVVVLFVAASLRHAAPRPGHGLGDSGRSFGRPLWRLLAHLGGAVLIVVVATRDAMAAVLVGTWRVVAWALGIASRVLAVVLRPVAFLARAVTWPARAVVGLVVGGRGDTGSTDDPDGSGGRSALQAGSSGGAPALADGPAPPGEEPSTGGNPWPDVDEAIVIDSPVTRDDSLAEAAADETAEPADEEAEVGHEDATVEPDADVLADDTGDEPDELSDGGPARRETVPTGDDGVDAADGEDGESTVGEGVDAVDDPFDDADEDRWPEGWISASDV